MLSCHDNFEANFDNYPSMLSYHQALSMASSWRRCKVKDLHVEPLDPTSPLYGHPAAFAAGTSEDAIKDTAANLGLALNVDGNIYPVRGTAYKTLTERAKINGTALPKLSRKDLANVLNACLSVHNSDALLLIRNEKVSAVHSGDETDYSVLPMDELLVTLEKKLGERFPGFVFESGYTDHAYTCGSWILPNQKEGILGAYAKALAAHGQAAMANRLVPGIRFMTSDTGVASAKVSALLIGAQQPIHIGDCIGVDHRNQRKIADFDAEMDKLFRMLDLGYASTVHKSQGAQYKSVILNLQCAHAIMLMRAIVYTAITRARLRLTIVGERKALCRAIRNTKADQRGTRLAQRIQDFIE